MGKERESIAKWISVLHRQFQIYLNRELKEMDINTGEYIFLVNLYEKDHVSQEQLSADLYINKAATARAMRRLEGLGYVERNRDPVDGRAYQVRLTDKGLAIRDAIKGKLNHWTKTISTHLSVEESEEMVGRLKQMSHLARIEIGKKIKMERGLMKDVSKNP